MGRLSCCRLCDLRKNVLYILKFMHWGYSSEIGEKYFAAMGRLVVAFLLFNLGMPPIFCYI